MLNFLNILVKNALSAQDYKQIGRLPKYFVERDKKEIKEYELEMWPGYLTTTRLLNDGIFLNVDTVSKFIQMRTILDFIRELQAKGHDENYISGLFDSSNLGMPRRTVLTKYNTKTYQVDGLDWKMTPLTCKFKATRKTKTGREEYDTNLVEYMATTYKLKVKDPRQPLFFVNFRDTRIWLLPEFCHEASLPEDFTKDSRAMRTIDGYKIKNPQDRFNRIHTLVG